ncbi:hypothetical protein CC2G_012367 [Coprinopsis cinerea AmutBmut pab1-1]|nr:hypothetical protein CC2G_012367 [Coprinopsis cinerea AmutBmut pab1-1]
MSAQLNLSFILIGSYLTVGIFALETAMLTHYLHCKRTKSDPRYIKYAVLFVYAMDVVGLVGGCALVYVYTFSNWGDATSEDGVLHWPFPITVITTALNAIVVQCFMIGRYWKFSRMKIITAILLALAFSSLFATISALVLSFVYKRLDQRTKHIAAVLVSMILAVATDISIAGCLIHKLWNARIHSRETRSLVKRVTTLAITAGCAPAINSIAVLIGIAAFPDSLISTSFSLPLGSIYACTMIYTLNRREAIRGHGHGDSGTVQETVFDDRTSPGTRRRSITTFESMTFSPSPQSRVSSHADADAGSALVDMRAGLGDTRAGPGPRSYSNSTGSSRTLALHHHGGDLEDGGGRVSPRWVEGKPSIAKPSSAKPSSAKPSSPAKPSSSISSHWEGHSGGEGHDGYPEKPPATFKFPRSKSS